MVEYAGFPNLLLDALDYGVCLQARRRVSELYLRTRKWLTAVGSRDRTAKP